MKTKLDANVKLYELSSEQTNTMKQDYCIHKSTVQIPTYLLVDRKLDIDLMRRAIQIEVDRNDCLRMHFAKTSEGPRQYFLAQETVGAIPFDDFTGKTKEDMMAVLEKDARTPVYYKKGEVMRIRLFLAPDGRYGIYMNISHLNTDLAGIFILYRDLLMVYDALEKGTEMPKPLDKYEDCLQRDLEKDHDTEKAARIYEKMEEYVKDMPISTYAGIDHMRQLNGARKRHRDPNRRCVSAVDPIFDKINILSLPLSPELTEKMAQFAEEQRVPMQSLIDMGLRVHLSSITELCDTTSIEVLFNRRAMLQDLNNSGLRVNALPTLVTIRQSTPFTEALHDTAKAELKMMRFADYPTDKVVDIIYKHEKIPFLHQTFSMLLSCIPPKAFSMPEGWNCEFAGLNPGAFAVNAYTMAVPDMATGGMNFNYLYRTHYIKAEEVREMHENMIKILSMGMENPEMTIGEIVNAL